MIYTLKNDKITVQINSLGAELISARGTDGYEYIWSGAEWCDHAPLLFPICGRILNGRYTASGREYCMSSHGFAKTSEFALASSSDTQVVLVLKSSEQTRKVYPFDFTLTASYTLVGEALKADFTVENTSDTLMPYMFGWHPGFNLWGVRSIDSFHLDFGNVDSLPLHPLQNGCFVNPSATDYPLDCGKYYINDSELTEKDTLIFRPVSNTVALGCMDDDRGLTLSWSDNIPYFCVWKAPGESVRFICLEPWSDVPSDGFTEENFDTRKMSRLSPMSKASYNYKINFA